MITQAWGCDEYESEPIYRREECYCCHREFSQDITQRWYLAEDVEENGMDHVRKWWMNHHTLTNTKQGYQCDDCAGDPEYLP